MSVLLISAFFRLDYTLLIRSHRGNPTLEIRGMGCLCILRNDIHCLLLPQTELCGERIRLHTSILRTTHIESLTCHGMAMPYHAN